jgi:hypothetical protein
MIRAGSGATLAATSTRRERSRPCPAQPLQRLAPIVRPAARLPAALGPRLRAHPARADAALTTLRGRAEPPAGHVRVPGPTATRHAAHRRDRRGPHEAHPGSAGRVGRARWARIPASGRERLGRRLCGARPTLAETATWPSASVPNGQRQRAKGPAASSPYEHVVCCFEARSPLAGLSEARHQSDLVAGRLALPATGPSQRRRPGRRGRQPRPPGRRARVGRRRGATPSAKRLTDRRRRCWAPRPAPVWSSLVN